jgi:hypothetical protein
VAFRFDESLNLNLPTSLLAPEAGDHDMNALAGDVPLKQQARVLSEGFNLDKFLAGLSHSSLALAPVLPNRW